MKKGVVLFFALVLLSLPAFPQEGREETFALKINELIKVDGFLNEAGWKKAPEAHDLIWSQSEKTRAVSANTSVKILYDDNFLYVGFFCYDSQPENVEARITERDHDIRDDDSVYVLIETIFDRDNLYYFGTNPFGTQFDGIIAISSRDADHAWNGIWKSAGQKTDFGWSAEIAIDLRSLKYGPGEDKIVGLSVSRIVPRMLDSFFWSGPLDPAFKISQLGQLKRLSFLKAERRTKFLPHVMPYYEQGEKAKLGGGFDVRYDFSQMIFGRLALNPDFTTVEPDEEQINLTRLELYVPEKRDFLREGSDIYDQPISLFYSKRIPDIWGGVKLQARSGGFEFLGMSVQAKENKFSGEDSGNFTVFRYKKNIMKSSSIGILGANKLINGQNKGTVGIDASLRLSNALKIDGQFAYSYGNYNQDNFAFSLCPGYDTETFHVHLGYSHLDESFGNNVNEVGFIRDDNRRELDSAIVKTFVINKGDIEQIRYNSSYNIYWGMDGVLRGWQLDQGLTLDLKNRFSFILHHTQVYYAQDDLLYEKDFRNSQTKLGVGFNTKEWELATLAFSFGRNFDWTYNLLEISKNLQLTRDFSVEYNLNRLYYAWGRSSRTTLIHIIKAKNYFTQNLILDLFYQTNSKIKKINIEGWLTYRFLPPSGFIQLVYQIGRGRFGEREREGNRLFLKIFYNF